MNESKSGQISLYKFHRLVNRMDKAADQALAAFDLSFSQLQLLLALGDGASNASQAELAERMGVTPAVVTRQVVVLSARGLVKQLQDPANRRRNALELSGQGSKLAVEAEAKLQTHFGKVFSSLDPTATMVMMQSIDRLSSALR